VSDRRDSVGIALIVAGMAVAWLALVYALSPFDACFESPDYQHIVRPDRRVAGSERPGLIPRPESANQLTSHAGRSSSGADRDVFADRASLIKPVTSAGWDRYNGGDEAMGRCGQNQIDHTRG
jgi:hypothetical protein